MPGRGQQALKPEQEFTRAPPPGRVRRAFALLERSWYCLLPDPQLQFQLPPIMKLLFSAWNVGSNQIRHSGGCRARFTEGLNGRRLVVSNVEDCI